jgi:hypothetical protein
MFEAVYLKDQTQVQSIHLLPCESRHNGPANIDRYFDPLITQ